MSETTERGSFVAYWILRTYPKREDEGMLGDGLSAVEAWPVSRRIDEPDTGDEFAVYKAGSAAAIIALGQVTGPVRDSPTRLPWQERTPVQASHCLPIKVTRWLDIAWVWRTELAEDPEFSDAEILTARGSANPSRLSATQWSALLHLINAAQEQPQQGERDLEPGQEVKRVDEKAKSGGDQEHSDVADPMLDVSAEEGEVLMKRHAGRERDPHLRAEKLRQARASGALRCEVCGLEPTTAYAGLVPEESVLDVHHIKSLSESGPTTTYVRDLAVLCPTCHRAIHRMPTWTTPAQLRSQIETQQGGPGHC